MRRLIIPSYVLTEDDVDAIRADAVEVDPEILVLFSQIQNYLIQCGGFQLDATQIDHLKKLLADTTKKHEGKKLATHSKAVLNKIAKLESLPDPPELEKEVFAMLKKLSEDKP